MGIQAINVKQNIGSYCYLGKPERPQRKVVFDASDCTTVMLAKNYDTNVEPPPTFSIDVYDHLTVTLPKIYDSNAKTPRALPNVVHKVKSQWN